VDLRSVGARFRAGSRDIRPNRRFGIVDQTTGVVTGVQAGRSTGNALNIDDRAASAADHVVVVAGLELESCR
jgi:hypothetical protein